MLHLEARNHISTRRLTNFSPQESVKYSLSAWHKEVTESPVVRTLLPVPSASGAFVDLTASAPTISCRLSSFYDSGSSSISLSSRNLSVSTSAPQSQSSSATASTATITFVRQMEAVGKVERVSVPPPPP
jgi:hypothetical protein